METVGWNPLLEERSHASSLLFPGFAAPANPVTNSRPSGGFQRPPQSANYPSRNSVKFSFNLSEFGDELDSLLPLPSPAISISPGVFFDDPFAFPAPPQPQRSPSLGIGSSLSSDLVDDASYRPSSVANFQFPKSGADWPYDTARARSAVPSCQRPGSSAEWRDDDSNESPIDSEELERWKEWNIKTAPGCPPLDQLFENKRRWREKFNQSVPPPLQRHCVFCKSINKPQSVYLSHAIRDAKGDITCPVLNAYNCPKCGKRGHTIRYCAVNQTRPQTTYSTSAPSHPFRTAAANSFGSSRLGSVGSLTEASVWSGRSSKSSLGFY